jgi:hypothetical protein
MKNKIITNKYSQNLWYIVSGAVEGGIGGESWIYKCKKGTDWKDYNNAKDQDYTDTFPSVTLTLIDNETDSLLVNYRLVNAKSLHDCLVKFVEDESVPDYLRSMYAGMLVTGKHPDGADGISDDCFMQYFFAGEILFS